MDYNVNQGPCPDPLLNKVLEIAVAAGEAILDVYNNQQDIKVTHKSDSSPLTEADRRAHDIIVSRLGELQPTLPVLSEESGTIDFAERSQWQKYWLVDPLDGTKEFIKRNGEFTVNIALVEDGVATAGVVTVPDKNIAYLGGLGYGAWKVSLGDREPESHAIHCRPLDSSQAVRVVASRSHRDEDTDQLIEMIGRELGAVETVSMGSSLKICLLAEGEADIYPRLAPTSEWDTAAAHAVLTAAGGRLVNVDFQPLVYNSKDELLNPFFIALADPGYDWQNLVRQVL